MNEYHKIQSVFLRDPATKHKNFLLWQFSEPVFEYLASNEWVWTEKIDGTNVRVMWDGKSVVFHSRTNDAQMPVFLMHRLEAMFPKERLSACFPDLEDGSRVTIFGEGYGAKIQKGGGLYKPDGCDFIAFDVLYNDSYLERHNVEDISAKLGCDVVPVVGRGSIGEAIELVKAGFKSAIGMAESEGLVLRPTVELRDRRGKRIITKIKHRDFQA